jgi:hypothetical protein
MTGAKKCWTCSNASDFRSLGPKVFSDQGFFRVQYSSKTGSPQSPQCLEEHHKLQKKPGTVPSSDQLQNQRTSDTPGRNDADTSAWSRTFHPVAAAFGVLFVGRFLKTPVDFPFIWKIRLYQILYQVPRFFASELVDVGNFPMEVKCYLWWGNPFIILWMAAKSCTSR